MFDRLLGTPMYTALKCPYSEFFWSVFSRIGAGYGEMRGISPYSDWMRGKAVQEGLQCWHFSRIGSKLFFFTILRNKHFPDNLCANFVVTLKSALPRDHHFKVLAEFLYYYN